MTRRTAEATISWRIWDILFTFLQTIAWSGVEAHPAPQRHGGGSTDVGTPNPMRWRPHTTKVSSPKRVVGPGVAVIHALAGALAALRKRAASRFPGAVAQSHDASKALPCLSASQRATSRWTTGRTECRDWTLKPRTAFGQPHSAAQSSNNPCQEARSAALLGPSRGRNMAGASCITS